MFRRIAVLVVLGTFAVLAGVWADNAIDRDETRFGGIEVREEEQAYATNPAILTVPWRINYQGFLTDDAGNPVSDTVMFRFRIFDSDVGGTELWTAVDLLALEEGLFNVILGEISPIPSTVFGGGEPRWLELEVESQVLSPRTQITSVAYAYKSFISDSADVVDGFNASDAPAANDLFPLSYGDTRYVNENQADAVTGTMILDGEIAASDLDVDAVITSKIMNLAVTSEKIAGDAVISGKVLDGSLTRDDVADTFKAPYADTADYAHAAPASPDNDWTLTGNVLYSSGSYGLSLRNFNLLYGLYDSTHVNLGVQCTTGTSGQNRAYCVVSGGYGNSATYDWAVIGGGSSNSATGYHSVIGGGENNTAGGQYVTIGGGRDNTVNINGSTVAGGGMNTVPGDWAFIGGGWANHAAGTHSVVGGGYSDTVNGHYGAVLSGRGCVAGDALADTGVAIAGGFENLAGGKYAFIGGGYFNTADGDYSTVSGGAQNSANGAWASVPGGYANTVDASDGFAATSSSIVLPGHSSSAAFNGMTTTSSAETRVGTISKVAGTFTIDHPQDPENRILNHYFVESPEMVLIYRGVATIGSDGRAVVNLPDYFDALNQSPMVQLTGVGTYEVYVAEKVSGNRFVIGGRPGTEVYWTLTGDRKDQPAEIARTLKPVEQLKVGGLAGRSLDDEYLSATMMQLESMGEAGRFSFRTSTGRQKYEERKRRISATR